MLQDKIIPIYTNDHGQCLIKTAPLRTQKKVGAQINLPSYLKEQKQHLYTSYMILCEVPQTALITKLEKHYIRDHLTLRGHHCNITGESINFDFID